MLQLIIEFGDNNLLHLQVLFLVNQFHPEFLLFLFALLLHLQPGFVLVIEVILFFDEGLLLDYKLLVL